MALNRDAELAIGIVLVILVAVGLFFSSTGGMGEVPAMEETAETSPGEETGEISSTEETGETSEPEEVTLRVDADGFSPESLEVSSGEITLTVDNTDESSHGFTIDELGVDRIIPGESSTTFSFQTDQGTYQFYDSMDPSLSGTLVVQ